jgi:hypothetical protein
MAGVDLWNPSSFRPFCGARQNRGQDPLLAIILVAKFQKPLPIILSILGILAATILSLPPPRRMGYFISGKLTWRLFKRHRGRLVLMAGWALIAGKADRGPRKQGTSLRRVSHHRRRFPRRNRR